MNDKFRLDERNIQRTVNINELITVRTKRSQPFTVQPHEANPTKLILRSRTARSQPFAFQPFTV